jgi:phosphohistidine phosphatase
MKKIYILRHAKAEHSNNGGDQARRLAPDAIEQCQRLANLLLEKQIIPDVILSSPAIRTKDTIAHILKFMQATCDVSVIQELYDSSPKIMLSLIQQLSDEAKSVMIVGHNPTVQEFCYEFAQHNQDNPYLLKLRFGMSPATLVCFTVNTTSWQKIMPTLSNLEWLL